MKCIKRIIKIFRRIRDVSWGDCGFWGNWFNRLMFFMNQLHSPSMGGMNFREYYNVLKEMEEIE